MGDFCFHVNPERNRKKWWWFGQKSGGGGNFRIEPRPAREKSGGNKSREKSKHLRKHWPVRV